MASRAPVAIPRALSRRIDRMGRAAHRFHRFAHHPLCDEYRGEVIRVGRRVRLCRGCTYLGIGLTSGAMLGAILAASPPLVVAAVPLAAACMVAGPGLLRGRPRAPSASPDPGLAGGTRATAPAALPKWASRLLPGAGFGFAFVSALRAESLAGVTIALLAVASFTLLAWGYRRRGPRRVPCLTCPERTWESPCRGFAPIVRRERAFRRRAGSLLHQAGL